MGSSAWLLLVCVFYPRRVHFGAGLKQRRRDFAFAFIHLDFGVATEILVQAILLVEGSNAVGIVHHLQPLIVQLDRQEEDESMDIFR